MTTPFERFTAAVDAQDDERAEKLVTRLGDQDEVALIEMAEDGPGSDRRWWAVRALALHGTAESVSVLVTALDDKDDGVRAAAALALAYLHDRQPQAVTPVLERVVRLLADEEGMVRQTATDSLTMCGDNAIDALAATLEGEHQGARTRAMMALRKISDLPAARIMFQYLNDENYLVHTYAYEGLDEMGLLENVLLMP